MSCPCDTRCHRLEWTAWNRIAPGALNPPQFPSKEGNWGGSVVFNEGDPFSSSLLPLASSPSTAAPRRPALFRKDADVTEHVSFWNLHHGHSWLNDFPWTRVNHPLLFDRADQPKPAFDTVMEELAGDSRPPAKE